MDGKRNLSWLRDGRVLILCGGCLAAGFVIGMLIFGSPWHLPPSWGDIPTWITVIATSGLLIGAIITAMYAIKAFGKQSEEVAALQEERNREVAERRRAHAAQVFIGPPHGAT